MSNSKAMWAKNPLQIMYFGSHSAHRVSHAYPTPFQSIVDHWRNLHSSARRSSSFFRRRFNGFRRTARIHHQGMCIKQWMRIGPSWKPLDAWKLPRARSGLLHLRWIRAPSATLFGKATDTMPQWFSFNSCNFRLRSLLQRRLSWSLERVYDSRTRRASTDRRGLLQFGRDLFRNRTMGVRHHMLWRRLDGHWQIERPWGLHDP